VVVHPRRLLASVTAWLLGAIAAVGVGMLALSMVGDGLTAHAVQPLTPDAVERQAPPSVGAPSSGVPSETAVAGGPSTARSSLPSATTPAARPVDKLVTSPGGTSVARCTGASAYLLSWSPEQGYTVHDPMRGPAAAVSVGFRSTTKEYLLSVRCVDGVPQGHVSEDEEDDGGGPGHG
jgi:hypothetical protein